MKLLQYILSNSLSSSTSGEIKWQHKGKPLGFFTLLMLIILTSCKKEFLEKDPLDKIAQTSFWKTKADADLALAACYNFLAKGNNATSVTAASAGWGGASMYWETITDNAYTISGGGNFGNLSTGVIEATSGGIQADAYNHTYSAIAACNIFLQNIGRVPLTEVQRNTYIGEVRFLRAYHYFFLSQLYGDVPLITKPFKTDIGQVVVPRTAKSVVIDTILADLDFAATNLPNTAYTTGHAVRGTALSYKAKVLLTNRRWSEAATAAQTVMTENKFGLSPDYTNLFLKPGQNNNPEIIFSIRFLPPNFYSPQDWLFSYTNSVQVLKNLVDEYESIDGLPITVSPLYNSSNPYANRDPRLKLTVITPGDWQGTTASTAFNPVAVNVASGFLPRKGIDPKKFPTTYATQSEQDWVLMRYADVLLMYAEARNEILAAPDATVYNQVNTVRGRPGINMPNLPPGLTKEQMRQRIQHERRIEFAMEGQRFFDLKRWRLDRVIIPTVKDPNNAFRTFPLRDTLWPVPQSEVDIAKALNNTGFKQTPGYD